LHVLPLGQTIGYHIAETVGNTPHNATYRF